MPPGEWDVVVSNPPYVADGDSLPPELRHEPAGALLAGPDGLDTLRRLVAAGAPLLVVEVGAGQSGAVADAAAGAGYTRTETRSDLAGIERVVIAWR